MPQSSLSHHAIVPRIVIAALKGGAGKTLLSLGLAAALRSRGLSLAVFKKGPDYIDAGWLGLAAGSDCYNLDPYLFEPDVLLRSFLKRASTQQIAIVEGNRGLFDGVDARGSYSTAEMAKQLQAPVILTVDATKVTRTAAALVRGCQLLDPAVNLRGVILNRVAGARHEGILRESIEEATSLPVIGSVMKMSLENFPQRHLGLLPLHEHPRAAEFVREAEEVVRKSVDLDRLLAIAESARSLACMTPLPGTETSRNAEFQGLRIGVLRDSAFQFYYPENLEALAERGAEVMELSALEAGELPDLDGLYIGGGFPETHAERLAANESFKASLQKAVDRGLPVYAECGGLMYLSRSLRIDDKVFPMAGLLPLDTVLQRKPQGHGYIRVEVAADNPFYPVGTVLSGHEFHYSYVTPVEGAQSSYAFRVVRGHGMNGENDGMCVANVLGTYVHVHALGTPLWAEGLLTRAQAFRTDRRSQTG
jgi:cobyrinic acid a,c-diamide synthase